MTSSNQDRIAAKPRGVAPAWIAVLAFLLLAGLSVAPFVSEEADMAGYTLPWVHATGGVKPWMPYDRPEMSYPPFMMCVWTAVAAVGRVLHVAPWGKAAIFLVKLPNLLAYALGSILCAACLRRFTDARRVALAYALCLPVWFNAAVWGQCDAMLALAVVALVIALLNDRPGLAGALAGWALSIKLQAVVVLPMAVVYTARRFGCKAVARAGGMAAVVLAALILPMAAAGRIAGVETSYTGTVGLFPYLSIDAFNPWALVKLFNIHVRHLPPQTARLDSVRWIGPVTPKRIGLLLFAGFTAFLMIGLWRRPTRANAALSAGLTAYGFYMLATQMHERYVIVAAALLALTAASGGGRIYLAVMIPALLNQVKSQVSEHDDYVHATTAGMTRMFDVVTAVVSAANCTIFLWICRVYWRRVIRSKAESEIQPGQASAVA